MLNDCDWEEKIEHLETLLEAAIGPEVAYWRGRSLTCADVAHTVTQLHDTINLDSVRAVLILNNKWYFLEPARPPYVNSSSTTNSSSSSSGSSGSGSSARGRSRYDWPKLTISPADKCRSPCHGQMRAVYEALTQALANTNFPLPYTLPDMVFVLNTADNMQRYGRNTHAPILSLQKWWRLPWRRGITNTTKTSLGRVDGKLVKSLGLPPSLKSFVSKAEAAAKTAGQQPLAAVGEAAPGGSSSSRSLLARRRRARVSKGPVGNVKFYAPDYTGSDSRRACISKGKGGSITIGTSGAGAGGAAADGGAAKGRARDQGTEQQDSRRRDLRLGGAAAAGVKGSGGAAAAAAAGGGGGSGRDVVAEVVREFVRGVSGDLLPPEVDVSLHRAHPNVTGKAARRQQADMDLLIPNMKVAVHSLYFYPKELKKDVAFFSGTPFCALYGDTHRICLRTFMANMSTQHPEDMDVRLVTGYSGRLGSIGMFRKKVQIKQSPPTVIWDHARYRYLLNLDGYAASSRLGALMAVDSPLIKSSSPFVEFFYRLLVPGASFVPFWSDPGDPRDVLRAVAEARRAEREDPEGARAAVRANQAIAARFLGISSRLVYARAALLSYHALVPDMATCVRDLVASLEARGESVPPS